MTIVRIGAVHDLQAFICKLPDGRHQDYIEHRINGGRQPETEALIAGVFDKDAEARAAAIDF